VDSWIVGCIMLGGYCILRRQRPRSMDGSLQAAVTGGLMLLQLGVCHPAGMAASHQSNERTSERIRKWIGLPLLPLRRTTPRHLSRPPIRRERAWMCVSVSVKKQPWPRPAAAYTPTRLYPSTRSEAAANAASHRHDVTEPLLRCCAPSRSPPVPR
jgi:hypothetical protein